MASARIPYNASTPLGSKIRSAVSAVQEGRKGLEELHRVVERYIDDSAGIATDSGIDAGNIALFRNLVNQAQAELTATALVQVNIGAETSIKGLVDSMG